MNHTLWMDIARSLAKESKCVSRNVGAVLVRNNSIISTGVNGTPPNHTNCCDKFPLYDPRRDREEHHKWSIDNELHAEVNMLGKVIQNMTDISGSTLYVTLQPCSSCATMIISCKGIDTVIFDEWYDKGSMESINTLRRSGIKVILYEHLLQHPCV